MTHHHGLLLAALALVVLGACGPAGLGAGAPAASGAAPASDGDGGEIADFALKDVDGRTHTLSEHLGDKVILLSFWATWCEPCKKEMTKLEELFSAHREKGLMVFSISMDEPETRGDVRPFVKQRRFSYPVLLDTESQVTNQFNPRRAAPYSLIIDRSQRIAWTHEGYVPGDEAELERAVLEALDLGAGE